MVKLSGILEYSMGGFLCLRGFTSYQKLSKASTESTDVQRQLIEEHKGEMANFLNKGEYRFFPEVVLSTSLVTNENYGEVNTFFDETQQNQGRNNTKLGNFTISVFCHNVGDHNKIAHIAFDENKVKLNRVDGNHRLSAANDVISDFKVPFCLILCRTQEEESQYSTAIFHNINAKQIPLSLEENLRVILNHSDVFPDNLIKNDASFGMNYYLARKTIHVIESGKYPFISALLHGLEYTYLKEEYGLLLDSGILPKSDDAFEKFCDELPAIESTLQDAQLHHLPQNIAVLGAISYYRLTDRAKYQQFLFWIKENCIADAPNLHMHDLIEIYDKVYENTPKTIFMSMPFGDRTQDTYQTVKDVRGILKQENNIEIQIFRVDEHTEGCSGEIYHRITEGIKKASLVIADLSYGNNNVHHEVGYAQGLNKKVLLLYQTREGVDSKSEIGSNLSMHEQLRFRNQTELRPALLKRIRDFFNIPTEE